MTKFSVTKNGMPLSKKLYTWDENTQTFSTNVDGLVFDFAGIDGVTFNTGSFCTFLTGYSCTFKTGFYCTFNTGSNCTFKTNFACTFNASDDCTFKTGPSCTFKTGTDCRFDTGHSCTFKTGYSCAFKTGSDCIFKTGPKCTFEVEDNCCLIRYDVKGVTEIPANKKIKLNDHEIDGYTFIKEKKEIPTCNGKVVEIDDKKYKLTEIKE
jgi:hypothetical protein